MDDDLEDGLNAEENYKKFFALRGPNNYESTFEAFVALVNGEIGTHTYIPPWYKPS